MKNTIEGQEVTEVKAKKQAEKVVMPARNQIADEISQEEFSDDGKDPAQRKERRILKPGDIFFLDDFVSFLIINRKRTNQLLQVNQKTFCFSHRPQHLVKHNLFLFSLYITRY